MKSGGCSSPPWQCFVLMEQLGEGCASHFVRTHEGAVSQSQASTAYKVLARTS